MNYVTLENSQHNTQNKEKVKSTSNYTLLINSDKAGLFKSSFSSGGKGGGGGGVDLTLLSYFKKN